MTKMMTAKQRKRMASSKVLRLAKMLKAGQLISAASSTGRGALYKGGEGVAAPAQSPACLAQFV